MALRRDQGIVLRGFPFGEADRVVVLLSPNHGKVRAVAKGVRKTRSRFGGRLEPFTHVDLVLYEGRNLETITQVSVIEAFPALRADLDRVLAAGTMVEVADAVTEAGEGSHRAFLLLQRGLRALEGGPRHPDLVASFLLKAAAVVGVAPAFDHCAGCGRTDDLTRFSFAGGGVLCENDRIPGAIGMVVAAGVSAEGLGRWSGALRLRYFGGAALIEDDSARSRPSALVNARLGYEFPNGLQLALEGFNLLDREDADITYFYASRLPGEPAEGVEDVHFHPVEKPSARLVASWRF